MHLSEETLNSQIIYEGRIFTVTKDTALLENGSQAVREVVHHSGGVCVIPITDSGEILMVKQFRYPFAEITLEIPAGKLEKNESHYECGKRELLEETGNICSRYEYLGEIYPTPAYLTEKIHMYIAEGLTFSKQNLDDDEFLDVVSVPMEKAVDMVMSGEIKDAKTQIGILKAYRLYVLGKIQSIQK